MINPATNQMIFRFVSQGGMTIVDWRLAIVRWGRICGYSKLCGHLADWFHAKASSIVNRHL
jgi:hypothetical protein